MAKMHRISVRAVNALGSRCRGGHTFTREPIMIKVTDEQLAEIEGDFMLTVTPAPETTDEEGSDAPTLTKDMSPAAKAIEAINAAETVEAVEAMVAGEGRKGVVDAAIKRCVGLEEAE